jgi:hypothetical protein
MIGLTGTEVARSALPKTSRGGRSLRTSHTAGNPYIPDSLNEHIWKVSATGIIRTVEGNGAFGHSSDGGPATPGRDEIARRDCPRSGSRSVHYPTRPPSSHGHPRRQVEQFAKTMACVVSDSRDTIRRRPFSVFDSTAAKVAYAGLAPGSVGLYQFNYL